MRGIREDDVVRLAVDQACDAWDRAMDAWDAITWSLARDAEVGLPIDSSGHVRVLTFDGARSISMPTIDVTYVFDAQFVTIKEAVFYEAPSYYAGHG